MRTAAAAAGRMSIAMTVPARMAAGLAMVLLVTATACRQPKDAAFRIPGADVERGRALIAASGCGACHVIPGVDGARGLVGPPLEAFGARAFIAGRLANEPDALVRWLLDPQSVDSLTAMPRVGLSPAQARDVAAYLYTLGAPALGPPALLPKSWLDAI